MSTRTKKQHFVPQWLLRRFASPEAATRGRVLVLRRGAATLVPSTPDSVGYGRYFYGPPEDGLEAALAELDSAGGDLVSRLDRGADPNDLAPLLARMTRLLAVRTRALRRKSAVTGEAFFACLAESMWQRNTQDAFVDHLTSRFDEMLEEEWHKIAPTIPAHIPPYVVRAIAWQLFARKRALIDVAVPLAMRHARDNLDADAVTTRGQIRGLSELLREGGGAALPDGWAALRWSIVRLEQPELVLGDVISFAIDGDTGLPVTTAQAGKYPAAVYLPLSPHQLLIGKGSGPTPLLDTSQVNLASARHSLDCVYASRSTAAELGLANQIGAEPGLIDPATMEPLVDGVWRKLGSETSSPRSSRLSPRSEPTPPCPETLALIRGLRSERHPILPELRIDDAPIESAVAELLRAPSVLGSVYAHHFKLGHLQRRIKLVSHYPMPIVFRSTEGAWRRGVGAAVGVAGAPPAITALYTQGPPVGLAVSSDTSSWIALFTRSPQRP